MDKKSLSERDICTKYITPSITGAGWDLHAQIREEVSFTAGRIIVRGKKISRAKYGENLLRDLAARLADISNYNRRQLYRYLHFYRIYSQIVGTLSPQFRKLLPTRYQALEKVRSATAQLIIPAEKFLNSLSCSHIELLVDLEENL